MVEVRLSASWVVYPKLARSIRLPRADGRRQQRRVEIPPGVAAYEDFRACAPASVYTGPATVRCGRYWWPGCRATTRRSWRRDVSYRTGLAPKLQYGPNRRRLRREPWKPVEAGVR